MRTLFTWFVLHLLLFTACEPHHHKEVYHPFANRSWHRFDILRFEIPVEKSKIPLDILFYAKYNRQFPYQVLNFNMIMRLPSGEERIREYQLTMKNKSNLAVGICSDDECEASLFLKKGLSVDKEGFLEIEVENLIPRIETPGLLGVGIRIQDFQE